MPLREYRSGVVAPDGGAEWLTEYICDWDGCRKEGEFDGLCEDHFIESGAAEEAEEGARQVRWNGEEDLT